MYEAAAKERWIMHGRLNIDLINSMRGETQQLKPSDFKYPYFSAPEQTQKERELQLAKMLQASGWAQVTIL